MTKPGHSAPIIPMPEADPETCEHVVAGLRDFRCPACKGILRRCCMTTLGRPHQVGCPYVDAREK